MESRSDPQALPDEHRRHLYEGEPDEDLIAALEPDQLVEVMDMPLARRRLSRRAQFGLWVLRLFLLALAAMALYAFVVGLLRPS